MEKNLRKKERVITTQKIFSYRNEMYGIAAIFIIFSHLLGDVGTPGESVLPGFVNTFLTVVFSKGNIGVDVFLFLSAIGLYMSMEKNTVKRFYYNRFKRVYVPYLIIMIPFLIWAIFIMGQGNGIVDFITYITTLNYWISRDTFAIWYVPYIIVLYLLFPLLHYLDKKTKHISTWTLLVIFLIINIICYQLPTSYQYLYTILESPISRFPVFITGILFAPYFIKDIPISKKLLIANFVVCIILLLLGFKLKFSPFILRSLGSLLGVTLVFAYGYIRALKDFKFYKIFAYIGAVSLEMYIVHDLIVIECSQLKVMNNIPSIVWYIGLPIVSYIISYAVSKLTKLVNTKVFR